MPTLDTIVVEVIERGPQGPQVPDGDKGDITVSSNGTVWNIDAGAVGATELATDAVETAKIKDANVTNAKLADMAQSTLKGRADGAGTGQPTDLSAAQVKAVLDYTAADVSAVPTTGGTMTGDLEMDEARIQITDADASPPEYSGGFGGSVADGPIYVEYKRTGGFGAYGNVLVNATVTAATGSGSFDVGLTSWQSHRNLTGGTVFGGWYGANTPSDSEGDTFSSGTVVGIEVNAGNRWSDPGRQTDIGSGRVVVGIQNVPDTVPEQGRVHDGSTYPGSFAYAIGQSVHGHRWWTGYLQRTDTLVATGWAFLLKGGSNGSNEPDAVHKVEGYWTNVLDTSSATISGALIKPGSNQDIGTTSARVRKVYAGGMTVFDSTGTVAGDSTFYVANAAGASFRVGFSSSTSNYISGANLYFRNQGETQDLMRLEAATGNLTPEWSGGTRSLGTSGKPWGPLYADSAVLGAPLPVASGGTGLSSLDWQSYTPTVSSGSGTITTLTGQAGEYVQIGKLCHFRAIATITTNGTGALDIRFTLPVTASAANVFLVSGYSTSHGIALMGYIFSTSTCALRRYDAVYPGGDGVTIIISGTYETA